MVSTRGVKLKFMEGERVLCYEPDPTKAKVLYDSKVLDVIASKDHRGRKVVEYLIHFQGWNSSWDRCVGEEYILKDTPENRQLQKDLAEKSRLQLGAYLYRKERKKDSRNKTNDRAAISSEDGSSGSPARMETDENRIITSSSEDDSSGEEDFIHIELTADLRSAVQNDFIFITTKKKLHKLPAEPNVATILELYYRHYVTNQIYGLNEKPNSKHKYNTNHHTKLKSEDIQKNIFICKEIMDGIRIYFDYTLKDLLLYKQECGQVETKQAIFEPLSLFLKEECKQENEANYFNNTNLNTNDDEYMSQQLNDKRNVRRRTLRSNKNNETQSNGASSCPQQEGNVPVVKPGSSTGSSYSDGVSFAKTLSWRLLPDHVYQQQPAPPCLVYGATHLIRLFVRLPELLMASSIAEDRLKILLQHFELFLDYINEHKEWYGEKYYYDVL